MRILYLIFVLCVAALLWVAWAAARHIRRHEAENKAALEEKQRSEKLSTEKELLVAAEKTYSD